MKKKLSGRLFVLLLAVICIASASAQEHAQAPAQPQAQSAEQQKAQQPVNPDNAASNDLSTASEKAVHAEEGEHEEGAEFKYSKMVDRLGRMIGLDAHGMYWVSIFINFLILGLFFWMLLKAKLPQMFRDRTNTIQKALKEAQAASAEASRRLSDIEARLAKLDSEVSGIKAEAEREAVAEEQRIKDAAEEDKHKVVAAAESEINAIARSARHELKSFAASLAVDIAAKKIKVDDGTDQALVREFVGHLGKDGQ
jgi:F-type H+-transporting ATPase subunit b